MPYRSRLSLDGQWNFWTDPSASLTLESLLTDHCSQVAVPAPWQSQPEFRHYSGVAWYQRTIEIPADWLAHAVILGFGAVDYLAEVWVNDLRLGVHEGGYLPFEFDVTRALKPGLNTLHVRVDDSEAFFAEIPHGKQSWYGPLSGLWQSAWIERRPATHIQRLKITPLADSVEVAITVNRPLTSGQTLALELLAPNGQLAARAEAATLICRLPISDPQLWDIAAPNLYALCATLHDSSAASDTLTETFGFRTIETRGGQLLLNGRPLYLRGALDQDYYPDLICTPPSLEYIESQFRQAKALGLNCLRTHIKIADPRYYAAADRAGLLIWTELPNWGVLTEHSKRRARETLAGMVERDWHHPSIVIWTIINESWGVDLTNPEHRSWLSEMYVFLKSLDPDRLIVGNSACGGNFQVVTDIEDFHWYNAIPDHYIHWRDWAASFAQRPWWSYAHAYVDYAAWREFARDPAHAPPRPPAPEVHRRGDEPLIVSEFGNWGLPDVGQLIEGYDGHEPWWFETGQERGDAVVYPHGIQARFRDYHLQRAFPTLAALSSASQRLQAAALKYEIEQLRRHASIQGYVITEFTDVHWECNGLLDMRRNPKAIADVLPQFNADDVIVPEWKRVAYGAGEQCEIKVLLSHYSPADLRGSRLEWQLDAYPDIRGTFDVSCLGPGRVAVVEVGALTFVVPAVPQAVRANLELRLLSADGSLAANNYQELYFFPPLSISHTIRVFAAPALAAALHALGYPLADSLASADIAVVNNLTDDLRDYMLQGGRVLWLAETEDALQTYLGDVWPVSRRGTSWQGDWAGSFSWLFRDHMFAELPTDGAVDFAFADLTPDYVLHGFNPREFASNVHAGLFVGWLHKPVALIGERRVGRGRVLACTFRLSQHLATHPVAGLMARDMLAHLAQT